MACKRSGVRSPLAPPSTLFVLLCLKIKHISTNLTQIKYPKQVPKRYTAWDLGMLDDFKYNLRVIFSRNNKWHVAVSIPEKYRQYFKDERKRDYSLKLDGKKYNMSEATAVWNGEVGEAIRDRIKETIGNADPIILKAEKFLQSLFATFDSQGKLNQSDNWHQNDYFPYNKETRQYPDLESLRHVAKYPHEYNQTVMRLRYLMTEFDLSRGEADSPDLSELAERMKRTVLGVSGEGLMSPTVVPDDNLTQSKADNIDFEIEQEEIRLQELATPPYAKVSKVGMVRDYFRKLTSNDKIYEAMSKKDLEEYEQRWYDSYNITKADRSAYDAVQTAWKEFDDAERAKSSGNGYVGIKFSEMRDGYFKSIAWNKLSGKTKVLYSAGIKEFIDVKGDLDLAQIDAKLAKDYLKYLVNDYKKLNGGRLTRPTIRKKLTSIRNVLVWIEEDSNHDFINTWTNIKIGQRGEKSLPRKSWDNEKLQRLFALNIEEQYKLILRLLVTTGCRLEEIIALRWSDIKTHGGVLCIDLNRESIPVKPPRNGDMRWVRRRVPIIERMLPYIELHKTNFEGLGDNSLAMEKLFPNFLPNQDNPLKHSTHASKVLLRKIEPVREKSTEFKLDVHSLRTTFSSLASSDFMPDSIRRKILGHKQYGRDAQYNWEGPTNFKKVKEAMDKIDFTFIRGGMI